MKKRLLFIYILAIYFSLFVIVGFPGFSLIFAQNIIYANPSNYLNLLNQLGPGDKLVLESGTYSENGLPVYNLHGTPDSPIIITGPETGDPAVIIGHSAQNTVRIDDSYYVIIKNMEIDCRYLGGDGVNGQGISHHITLENLYIHGFSDDKATVGISTNRAPVWNWVVRNNIITDGGTGIYFGNSDGNEQFVNGTIENNLIYDTIGYNMEIKHQNPRPSISGMPTEKSITIIRNNVFRKDNNSSTGESARPNLLVGHLPESGPGTDDEYHIYGNLFLGNPVEASFQGEGNVGFYNNIIVNIMNSGFSEIAIQVNKGAPKMTRVFNNTIVSINKGIIVSGGDPNYEQKVIGNAVFSSLISISAADKTDNFEDSYSNADTYLNNPFGQPGTDLDLFPKQGRLSGSVIDSSSFNTFTDWNKDFNGNLHDGTFRGAYSGDGQNPGWPLKLERRPLVLDKTGPSIPQELNASALSDSSINLTWQSSSDPESGISSYKIYRNNTLIGQSTTTSYSDTGLNEGTTYTYEVSAINGAGLESGKSTQVSTTTLSDTTPPTIDSVSASSDPTRVSVVFSESVEQSSAENISNYNINNGIAVSGASLASDLKTVTLSTSSHTEGNTYTVTINNIRDRANTPNVIALDTQASYTFVAEMIISNLSVTSGNTYEIVMNGLQTGALLYSDRQYTFTSIPSSLQGATYIKTANDDKDSTDSSFLTFDVNQNVTVYIAHDDQISVKPSWLASFTDTGVDLTTSAPTLSLFARDFPAGTIMLGGNEGSGYSMYSVIIQGTSSTDTVSPKPPTNLRKKE